MLKMLVDNGYLDAELLKDEKANEQQIVEALYRGLKDAPSKLIAASITDAVGEKRAQNQPGTNNEYPNWRIPLADYDGNVVPLEQLFDNERLQSLIRNVDSVYGFRRHQNQISMMHIDKGNYLEMIEGQAEELQNLDA